LGQKYTYSFAASTISECTQSLQEHKVIVKTDDLPRAQLEIQSRLDSGLDYNTAASTVYSDLGRPVNDLDSWVDYQAIEGCMEDEHAVASLQVRLTSHFLYMHKHFCAARVSAEILRRTDDIIEVRAGILITHNHHLTPMPGMVQYMQQATFHGLAKLNANRLYTQAIAQPSQQ